jgi:hypothetical protein
MGGMNKILYSQFVPRFKIKDRIQRPSVHPKPEASETWRAVHCPHLWRMSGFRAATPRYTRGEGSRFSDKWQLF